MDNAGEFITNPDPWGEMDWQRLPTWTQQLRYLGHEIEKLKEENKTLTTRVKALEETP